MTNTDPIPLLRDELERKTVDELVRLGHQSAAGRLDGPDYSLAAQSIWNVTSGLVGAEVNDYVTQAAAQHPTRINKRHFVHPGGTVASQIWRHDKPGFLAVARTPGRPVETRPIACEPDERDKKLQIVREKMLAAGWTEL